MRGLRRLKRSRGLRRLRAWPAPPYTTWRGRTDERCGRTNHGRKASPGRNEQIYEPRPTGRADGRAEGAKGRAGRGGAMNGQPINPAGKGRISESRVRGRMDGRRIRPGGRRGRTDGHTGISLLFSGAHAAFQSRNFEPTRIVVLVLVIVVVVFEIVGCGNCGNCVSRFSRKSFSLLFSGALAAFQFRNLELTKVVVLV